MVHGTSVPWKALAGVIHILNSCTNFFPKGLVCMGGPPVLFTCLAFFKISDPSFAMISSENPDSSDFSPYADALLPTSSVMGLLLFPSYTTPGRSG